MIDTEDGEYAIWDNQTDDYYVDPEGVTEYFTDEWLANDYLEEVRQSVAAMESVQPEAPVAEPAEVVEASASEEPKCCLLYSFPCGADHGQRSSAA